MFNASENCARTPPAALDVDPAPSRSRSRSRTSTPASARWKAVLVPITPPPTTTTSARAGSVAAIGQGNHGGGPVRWPDMELSCPKCHGAMRSYERSGIVIDQCNECRGVFLDRGELEKLIDAEFREVAAAPAWGTSEFRPDDDRYRYQ